VVGRIPLDPLVRSVLRATHHRETWRQHTRHDTTRHAIRKVTLMVASRAAVVPVGSRAAVSLMCPMKTQRVFSTVLPPSRLYTG
jgi:hypothetical protein